MASSDTYDKQSWNTNSYVNPTRMNHIEEGIYNGETQFVDITVTTDESGFVSLGNNAPVLKVVSAVCISPEKTACELFLNTTSDTNLSAYVYKRGEYSTAKESTECVIRVWRKN